MTFSRNPDFEQRLSGVLMPEHSMFPVRWFAQGSSTMDLAKEWLESSDSALSADLPGLVVADSQFAGRGRQGRTWQSAAAGFYGTYVFGLKSQTLAHGLPSFSLVVGCVIQSFLREKGAELRLKWPNDIVTPALRKLGGILLELFNSARGSYVLVGIGINLEPLPDEQRATAPNSISWAELTEKKLAPLEIASELSLALVRAWRKFEQLGFQPFKPLWEASALELRTLKIDSGAEILQGQMVGISDTGALLLRVGNEVKEIVSGHIL